MSLNKKQQEAIEKVSNNNNVFVTGPAGTGKTYFINQLTEKIKDKSYILCALTGCASLLLGTSSMTLHSWCGYSYFDEKNTCEKTYLKLTNKSLYKKRWNKIDILILDEVSMLSKYFFELLDYTGKCMRNQKDKPFGGVQVVFIGDFFQLPPVNKEKNSEYCFESSLWNTLFHQTNHIYFDEIMRQKEKEFIDILLEVRKGVISKNTKEILEKKTLKDSNELDGSITRIVPLRSTAEHINEFNYKKNKNKEIILPVEFDITKFYLPDLKKKY